MELKLDARLSRNMSRLFKKNQHHPEIDQWLIAAITDPDESEVWTPSGLFCTMFCDALNVHYACWDGGAAFKNSACHFDANMMAGDDDGYYGTPSVSHPQCPLLLSSACTTISLHDATRPIVACVIDAPVINIESSCRPGGLFSSTHLDEYNTLRSKMGLSIISV